MRKTERRHGQKTSESERESEEQTLFRVRISLSTSAISLHCYITPSESIARDHDSDIVGCALAIRDVDVMPSRSQAASSKTGLGRVGPPRADGQGRVGPETGRGGWTGGLSDNTQR